MVAGLAVGEAFNKYYKYDLGDFRQIVTFMFVEISVSKRFLTFFADKTLWVPLGEVVSRWSAGGQ